MRGARAGAWRGIGSERVCGIAGILRVHSSGGEVPPPEVSIPEAWLDTLDDSIKHRGPDGEGRFRDRVVGTDGRTIDVALVHRRLSIIDLAGGHQPMVLGVAPVGTGLGGTGVAADGWSAAVAGQKPGTGSSHRTAEHELRPCPRCATIGKVRVAVAFNGCIYNHRELRRELEAAGHDFSTDHSDTEVLVHGWAEWGERLCDRLRGMFAIVLWDRTAAVMRCVRDPFGEKPLYVARMRYGVGSMAVCSAVSGLQRLPPDVLDCGRSRSVVRRRSLVRWIRYGYGGRVLPAVRSVGRESDSDLGSALRRWSYRRPERDPHARVEERDQTREEVREESRPVEPLTEARADMLLAKAVERRIEADVPLGCFLSGGVDSSLIALHARRAAGALRTYCVRMPSAAYDESPIAERVSDVVGSEHATLDIEADPASELVSLITTLGLPFGDSSLLPTYWLSRAVRRDVKVALSGDGGDELFCGYNRYRAADLLGRHGTHLARLPASILGRRNPKALSTLAHRLIGAARAGNPYELQAVFDEPWLVGLIGADLGVRRERRVVRPRADAAAYRSWDLIDYLPDDLLRKTDTASMMVGLEVRAPFLDHDLARRAMVTPIETLMPGGQRKGLLRAVARRYFPAEIIDRPKMGFAIPIGEWFRTDYGGMRRLLLDHLQGPEPFGPDRLGIGSMISMGCVRRMLREHDAAGERSVWPWKGRDHSQRLYMLLVLSIWAKWLSRA